MTFRTWLLAAAAGLIVAGCRDDPINGTPHPRGGDWTRPGTFMIAATAALLVLGAIHLYRRRLRRGRHRAAG